jgi:hypothetical protein
MADSCRVFLVGSPRSRTTVAQTVISQACNLATMASTNWYLEHRSTRLLNGLEGWTRERARPFAVDRVATHVQRETGVVLPDGFRLEEALDLLAAQTGALGWLEKTPLHVLALAEIAAEIPDARVIHVVRDPEAVIASLIRRAHDNPGMLGARHQGNQKNDEAVWRECLRATLQHHGMSNHLVIYSELFVDNPEAEAARAAAFLEVAYRPPHHPDRITAAQAATPSRRPWKRDATGSVRRISHDDDIVLEPLDPETESLWQHAQQVLGIGPPSGQEAGR